METKTERENGAADRAAQLVKRLLDSEESNAKSTLMVMRERVMTAKEASMREHAIEHEARSKQRLKEIDEARRVVDQVFARAQEGGGDGA